MSKKLVLVSLGGIQRYISQARKPSDLKNSSEIVVNLIKQIEAQIKEQYPRITFLLQETEKTEVESADFFIVSLETNKTVRQLEKEICEIILEENFMGKQKRVVFPKELKCFVAACDYEADYETAYCQLYRRYHALKNDQLACIGFNVYIEKKVETEEICTVCGVRPWDGKTKRKFQEKEEFLCEECAKKVEKQISFPSTKELAEIGMKEGKTRNYYALIRIDLDNLGLYLSGKKGRREEGLLKYQETLIKRVNLFLQEIKNVTKVEKNNLLIYAGGDDILFFCPLHKIWPILKKVEQALETNLGEFGITCSKSILIAQVQEPLRRVVKKSNEQLEAVKKRYQEQGKGGTCIMLLYRGSRYRNVYLKRGEICEDSDANNIYDRIELLTKIFQEKKLSRSIIFTLEEELMRLGECTDFMDYRDICQIVETEITRTVARKYRCKTINEKKKQIQIQNVLFEMFKQFTSTERNRYEIDFQSYFDLLHIIDKLAHCYEGR